MNPFPTLRPLLLAAPMLCAAFLPLHAQPDHRTAGWQGNLRVIGLLSHATPAVDGESATEAYFTQPMLSGRAGAYGFDALVTLNFERWTLERGELNAGISGEGYVDRRHPHTILHQAVLTARTRAGGVELSLTGGRGFVPFGTDDPMVRPFVKFPANHHLAQILERNVVMAALRAGPVILEGSTFNGDEPTGPTSLGEGSRFADSWSARITVLPQENLEGQASYAYVESPEHAPGGGLDQRKWSASLRAQVERGTGRHVYALFEWARTIEYDQGRRVFVFQSWLAEASWPWAGGTAALRLERTTRPEEERLANPFRAVRPHTDANIIGVTRWHSAAARFGLPVASGALRAEPFLEAALLHVNEITGSIFHPDEFYGNATMVSLSIGVEIGAGAEHPRVGRYGVAAPSHMPRGS